MTNNLVVAKLVRLGQDSGKFKKELVAAVERERVVVDNDYLEEANKSWATTGRLYIVDKAKTKARDESLKPKAKTTPDTPKV